MFELRKGDPKIGDVAYAVAYVGGSVMVTKSCLPDPRKAVDR